MNSSCYRLNFLTLISTLFLFSCTYNSKNASIQNEQLFINLGGEEQYIEIMGGSAEKPVLLFLHGGPGWPQTPHLRYFNSELTNSVTLVSWDQSGCGKSYIKNPNPKSLSLEKLINDAHELTLWLMKKYNTDKIYLAGFSWGSIIGLNLINRFPNNYHSYIGISQVVNLQKSIDHSREWIKQQAELKNDSSMLKKVELLATHDTSFCKSELDCFFKKYEMLTEYNGAIHKKEIEIKIKDAETTYDDYKKYDWISGFMYSANMLGLELFKTNLSSFTSLKVPVYFMIGRHDHSLPSAVTEEFFKNLQAPKKEIIWFENSGHEPLEEEAELFNKKVIELINYHQIPK